MSAARLAGAADIFDSNMGDHADTGGTAHALPFLLAAAVLCCVVTAWAVLTPRSDGREPGRTYAVWHASEAVTAYARLHQVIAANREPAPDATPGAIDEVGSAAQTFAQSVTRLHEGDQAVTIDGDPVLKALVHRLDADRQQLPVLLRDREDSAMARPGRPSLADETMELARLNEAVNQESAILAEEDQDAWDRLRLLAAVPVIASTVISLLLISVLARKLWDGRVLRGRLDEAETRLREALRAASRAEAVKSRFIATASHDLRAPMDAVMSLADSLLEEPLPPMQREITGKIRDAGRGLLRALDDVIDYTTLESGDLTLDERPFSPEAATVAAVIGIEAHARGKGLTIVAIPSPGLPKLVVGDPDRIGRILFRLASNAVKFTEKGGVTLQVLCVERDATRVTIEWVITDTGIGISPARLDHLFGPEGERAAEGSGLGLEVCKRLVARMGGRMTVQSTLEEGSRFHVRVPFRVERRATVGATAPVLPSAISLRQRIGAMGRQPRLLMAEDTPGGQFILRQLLAREGIAPTIVGDGRAAVTAAEADCYDVICLDLKMPEMDGIEAAKRIRAGRGPSANAPIIAVTASSSSADIQACQDAGMTLFVTKPVRRETLLNAILTAMTGEDTGGAAEAPREAVNEDRRDKVLRLAVRSA